MAIKVENLTVTFGDKSIFTDISLEFSNKRFTGIIGPNGSGKSTFLKCIYRILKPDSGTIFLDDKKLEAYSVKETAQKQAVLAQHNYYNFDFKVLDVVLMGRTPYKKLMEHDNAVDYRLAKENLNKVGMESFANSSFSTLSGGEQQRILLARAMTQTTQCLILDEPTNHLDIKYQLQLLSTIKNMNITVIAAIHDLNMAAKYCDYLFAMKDGAILRQGTPVTVLTPEFIYEMYEVTANVIKLGNGRIAIVYE